MKSWASSTLAEAEEPARTVTMPRKKKVRPMRSHGRGYKCSRSRRRALLSREMTGTG